MVKLNDDIARGEKFLEVFNRYNRDQLTALRQANEAKTQNVRASIVDWENKVVDENNRIVQGERLKLNVERAQTAYDRLTKLVENVAIGGNLDQETLAVLEPASPALRSYNKEARALVLGLFGGLILGFGSLLLLMVRDDRIVTCGEINDQMNEAVLTQVPAIKSLNGNGCHALLQVGDARHTYAESFRSLRSALMFMEKDGQSPKVVLVTSALPGEGKSTIAANLARALALGGSRVALVDADSRKGVLHEMLKLERSPGLTDILHDSGDLKGALQTNSVPNLTFIACGTPSPDGCDLFLGTSFERMLKQLRAQFDYVLIDSSPVFATDDAPSLAPRVDGTLFVVRSRFSSGRAVRDALDILYQRNARVLGLVFNHVDPSESSYHYYKYADYFPPTDTNTPNSDSAPHAHAEA
jgi:capsular exopolysaccharide synthesis family protein